MGGSFICTILFTLIAWNPRVSSGSPAIFMAARLPRLRTGDRHVPFAVKLRVRPTARLGQPRLVAGGPAGSPVICRRACPSTATAPGLRLSNPAKPRFRQESSSGSVSFRISQQTVSNLFFTESVSLVHV